MGRIEEQAKPIVGRLIRGERLVVDSESRKVISTWAVLKTIVAEYVDPEFVAISQDDRKWFMEHREPLPNCRIWIASFYERVGLHYDHESSNFMLSPPGIMKTPDMPDSQVTTITIGRLVLHIATSSFDTSLERHSKVIGLFRKFQTRNIFDFWPGDGAPFEWPRPPISLESVQALGKLVRMTSGV